MKKKALLAVAFVAVLALIGATAVGASSSKNYGDVTLSGGFEAGHFEDVWSLSACDMTIRATVDLNGMVDELGGDAHAWAELGVRAVGYGDFNPTWMLEGAGVWLATDYDWTANTFNPDPPDYPTLDIDDKLILQKAGGHGEGYYNLPSTPPNPWANHAVWFDRDGVDEWQAQMWGAIDGVTYNTGGTYDVVITLHADDATSGTAYMTVNGEPQGFYVPNWHSGPADLMPAGMTFTGDMKHLQVFYGMYGYGATHSVTFENIEITGCLQPRGEITSPGEDEIVFGPADFDAVYFDDDPGGVSWAVRYGTCAAATNTVFGNVDGRHDPYDWDKHLFHATADTSYWEPGRYCFVFNPVEGPGEDDIRLTRWFTVVPLPVDIDIKPGSYPNAINLGANGVIPVAIFGSADFDVTEIDFSTVSLEGAAVRVKGKSDNYGSFDDLNLDGYMDVVIQVYNEMEGVLEGTTTATLTGKLIDGPPFEGTDEIVIVPPK